MKEEEDEEDDLFVRKDKTKEEEEAEEEDYKKFLLESMASKGSGKEEFERWQNYRDDPSVNKDEAFLMDYILNRGWVDQPGKSKADPPELEVDLDEDEDAVDAADDFESQYNFRFEEPGADQIITHSRHVAGSVRRPDDRRKLARQHAADRKEEEKAKKREELKRLKNLKKAEILRKLRQIQDITGNDAVGIDAVDLEADFNPEDYDGSMSKVFNEDYYHGEVRSCLLRKGGGEMMTHHYFLNPCPSPPPSRKLGRNLNGMMILTSLTLFMIMSLPNIIQPTKRKSPCPRGKPSEGRRLLAWRGRGGRRRVMAPWRTLTWMLIMLRIPLSPPRPLPPPPPPRLGQCQ